MKIIPLLAHAGIVGFESPAAEYTDLELSLDELLIEHPSSSWIALAVGTSMTGVGIFDGDILVIDRHETARNTDVIVANLNGEFTCKIIDFTGRQLLSACPHHRAVSISEHDEFTIEGVVSRSVRCHRPSPLFTSKS
ncbi:S24 family peptidase [Alginatibacterium sediminis]|uniref:S24 family peptidase n=1 Tax=Alginatibacterium sediminis TaxID=2164068 RepID=A0A420EGW5_9ALTE|nr:S24 family peptidase [Alginatibacterium sediminis]RKF19961.1 S24 family peptidase [Alginatibacterium sediminis]